MKSMFDYVSNSSAPLAERMRPTNLDDFVGQSHIVGANSLLRRAIKAGNLGSCIFYGGPGCGKTTLANIISKSLNCNFVKLNAVSSGVADAKKVIEDATQDLKMFGRKTYLLLDECHRWSKAQSDCVLAAIEDGSIIFIGSTTENPYVTMTRAIVSRCRVFEFKKLTEDDIIKALNRAILDKNNGLGNYNLEIDEDALKHIAWAANGDARDALNSLELAVTTTTPDSFGKIKINLEIAEQSSQRQTLTLDESMYYDIISAFCKSLRGSDSDAALYWAERLLQSGCDPLLILRRLVVHSSEDVGMADPNALVVATSALTAFKNLGLPEGKIPMYNAIIYVCEAPKSNSVVNAMHKVEEVVSNCKEELVPAHLQDQSYKPEKNTDYKYPHSYGGWVEQTYLPESLKDMKFYEQSDNGFESKLIRAKVVKANKKNNKGEE